MSQVDFFEMEAAAPAMDEVAARYADWGNQFDAAANIDQALEVLNAWDAFQRELETWSNLTHLRFEQDTRNKQYDEARQLRDRLWPKLTEFAVNFKRKVLASSFSDELRQHLGATAFGLWDAQVATYEPVIEQDSVRESELEAEYTQLLASAQLTLRGEQHNLSGILKFREAPDRSLRHEAESVRWQWFEANRPQLDRIFDDLVKLRTSMAGKLGMPGFVELGYKRMTRIDYDREDVERFRQAVREQVVPVAAKINQRRAQQLGLDKLAFWDESMFDPRGNPAPQGDHDWLIDRATQMFDQMGQGLDAFFRLMVDRHLLDLKNREGKAGGGFCTSLDTYGVPFIFANFNGTRGDVEVFTHEMGHAFQNYCSQSQPLMDYVWPTYESCEIHSMALEFLTWPSMELFFGDDAERFRQIHLGESLLFLPYGVAIDHFQHLVYEHPEATPAERHAMWREMELSYLPWRDYGQLPHVGEGGFWQVQRHVYLSPFYYIDYTLALTCALQFWARSRQDFPHALEDYVDLCRLGGSLSFQHLVRSADLVSPFDANCLTNVVRLATDYLNLD